ncbi:hypothetical protein FACS1894151_10420 [Spirochaetia bacterium]|nr:hypothetical protein FACS1894151_10420 [Spirochaetia bacterium]
MNKRILLTVCIAFVMCLQSIMAQSVSGNVLYAFQKARIPVLQQAVDTIDFTVPLLDGKMQRLSALRGKVVILNIWATWCPPCRSEMPSMQALYSRYKNQGLEILAIDSGESKEDVAAFINRSGFSFPIGLDESYDITAPYATGSIPTTYIIDRQGKIVSRIIGSLDWSNPNVQQAFEALLR